MRLDDLKRDRSIINEIDWSMTPEEAVRLYLEWGNNWSRGGNMVRGKGDTSHYFVLNTWEEPVIYLIKRNSEEAVELAEIEIPEQLKKSYVKKYGSYKGIYGLTDELKDWLKYELDA